MPYLPNIPAATDQISVSQGQIQNNFQSIFTSFTKNHVDFNAGADAGKHSFITFVNQAVAPFGLASEFLSYNKIPAAPFPLSGNQELFIERVLGASPYIAPMTLKSFNPGASSYAYLPCGILMKFGAGVTAADGKLTVNMDAIAQVYTSLPFIFLTADYTPLTVNSRFASLRNQSSSSFEVSTRDSSGNSASGSFQWLAIGVY